MKKCDETGEALLNIRGARIQKIRLYMGFGHFLKFAGLRLGKWRIWVGFKITPSTRKVSDDKCFTPHSRQ